MVTMVTMVIVVTVVTMVTTWLQWLPLLCSTELTQKLSMPICQEGTGCSIALLPPLLAFPFPLGPVQGYVNRVQTTQENSEHIILYIIILYYNSLCD